MGTGAGAGTDATAVNGTYNRLSGNGFNRTRVANEPRQHYDSSPYKRGNYSNSTGNPVLDNQYNANRANEAGDKSTTQVSIPKEVDNISYIKFKYLKN